MEKVVKNFIFRIKKFEKIPNPNPTLPLLFSDWQLMRSSR